MKIKKFVGKRGTIVKIFLRVRKFFENRGKSETGRNASWSQRGWTPLLTPKDQDKDKVLTPKDQDKDLTPKDQDKDKDLKNVLKESLTVSFL